MNNSKWAMAIVAVCLVVTVAAVAYAAEQAKKAPPEVVQAQRVASAAANSSKAAR